MLDQHLNQLVADVDGATGAALGGFDGLLVEAAGAGTVDLSLLVAEHAGLLGAAFNAYENTVGGGRVREMWLRGDHLCSYSLPVNQDLFLMVVLGGQPNLGQARLYGMEAARRLKEAL